MSNHCLARDFSVNCKILSSESSKYIFFTKQRTSVLFYHNVFKPSCRLPIHQMKLELNDKIYSLGLDFTPRVSIFFMRKDESFGSWWNYIWKVKLLEVFCVLPPSGCTTGSKIVVGHMLCFQVRFCPFWLTLYMLTFKSIK